MPVLIMIDLFCEVLRHDPDSRRSTVYLINPLVEYRDRDTTSSEIGYFCSDCTYTPTYWRRHRRRTSRCAQRFDELRSYARCIAEHCGIVTEVVQFSRLKLGYLYRELFRIIGERTGRCGVWVDRVFSCGSNDYHFHLGRLL